MVGRSAVEFPTSALAGRTLNAKPLFLRNQVSEHQSPLDQQALTRIRLDVITCYSYQNSPSTTRHDTAFSASSPSRHLASAFMDLLPRNLNPLGVCTATLCQESVAFCPISSAAVIGALHELPRVSRNLHLATFVRHYVPPGRLGNVQLPPSTALRLFASQTITCGCHTLPIRAITSLERALPSLYRYH